MVNFTVNVVSDKEDKRIPAALAGQIMVDIQDLFIHIGEYLVAKELRLQGIVDTKFDEKFRIYLDSSEGVSIGASTGVPETEGRGNLVDDAVVLMDKTLEVMGNGTGSYWMEDNYKDALYRNAIIYDLVAIHQDLVDRPGYSLMYGTEGELKKFNGVDVKKMSDFIHNKGLTCDGATIGVIERTSSKSQAEQRFGIARGDSTAKLVFANAEEKAKAEALLGRAAVIGGVLSFTEEGMLSDVAGAGGCIPVDEIKFGRMVSSTGDVVLKAPLAVNVKYSKGTWTVSNEDLGMSMSKKTWDEAVQSFHDYFIFLWTQYAMNGDEGLSEEELEVKSYLLSLIA